MDKKEKLSSDELYMKIVSNRTSAIDSIDAECSALHEEIEIKCFYGGASTLLIGDSTLNVEAGDIVIINPYEFHATLDCGEEAAKGRYHLFMIPVDFFSQSGINDLSLRSLLLANNKSFKTVFKGNKRMYKILMRIVKEYEERKIAYTVAISGLMMELFAILIRKGIVDKDESDFKKDNLRYYRIIEPALRYIRDEFSNDIGIEKLSLMCGVSRHYFCRLFKTVTGKTAMEYLRDYRLRLSDALLCNTDKSITQIADVCGFESVSYFCRCYKEYYGFPPSKRR